MRLFAFGHWAVDDPGSGLQRQTVTVKTAGRATRLVRDLAKHLADVLTWGEYGKTVIPWGMPYGIEPGQLTEAKFEDGAIVLRPGLASAGVEHIVGGGIDRSTVSVDILMIGCGPKGEPSFLDTMYDRMVQVEDAVEAISGVIGD